MNSSLDDGAWKCPDHRWGLRFLVFEREEKGRLLTATRTWTITEIRLRRKAHAHCGIPADATGTLSIGGQKGRPLVQEAGVPPYSTCHHY